jgi:SpoVK/Ycf46/Vps4 family AAA+-type ATPase
VDNPTKAERRDILEIYMRQFLGDEFTDTVPWSKVPDLDGYSGAEIRQVAIETAYNGFDLETAARFVIPISKSQKQQMDALREWAKARTIPASKPQAAETKGKRRVQV